MHPRLFAPLGLCAALGLYAASPAAQDKPAAPAAAAPVKKDDAAAAKKKADKNELPLDPKDKLEFETDEGTWISLDVLPDGSAILFELLGDLYRVPIAGGEAVRVTEGTPYDAQPRVSPDGKWIAFISDRNGSDNLWIAKVDGKEPRKLSNESQDAVISPIWTPDSQYVIASVRGTTGTQLRMFHINGGSGIALTGGGGGDAPPGPPAPPGAAAGPTRLGASVAPDGRYLYVSQAGGAASLARWQIARFDMRSGDADIITQAEGGGLRPVVSPDGKLVVYATRHETKTGLRVRDLTTGADRWLKWPIDRDEVESGGSPSRDTIPGYAFMPDGREIVISYGGKIHRVNVATGADTLVPFTAKVSLDIGPDLTAPYRVPQGPVRARLIQDPRQSPDGKRVVMSVLTHLYVMDVGSGAAARPKRLMPASTHGSYKPVWSPDGQWIAYVTWSPDGVGHIWKVRADGSGQPQQLTKISAFYTDITFSPDGERIVGLRGNEYQRQQTFSEFGGLRIPLDLVWLPSGGGDVQLIVPARGLGRPHFTSDVSRVFVYSNSGLISLRYDGTDRRTHLRVTGPGRSGAPTPPAADAVQMRPDGRWALADVNNQLWVVAVPPYTGAAASVSVRSPSLPVKRLTDIGSDYFAWADGGKTITWAIGSTFFRRSFDTIDFGPAPETEKPGEKPGEKPVEKPEGEKKEETKKEDPKKKDPLDLDKNVERFDVVIEVPRATPSGTIALRGATLITSKGDEVIQNGDIVITDNRIAAIGKGVKIPAGARVIDVKGKYITPGFVDTHAHWEFRTHDVLEPQNWSLVANLAYGVTAGLDVQTSTNDYFAYQDLVETGQSLGQRAFMTGPGVFSNNDFQSYEATLAYLKRYKEHYRTPNIKSYMVGNRKQRQWVVQAAKELGLMPTTEGGRDMKMDITHAIDGMHGNEHTLPVFPLYKDVVQVYARTKTAYTPTLLVNYGGIIAEEYFYVTTEVHDDKKLNRFYPHNVLDDMSRRRRVWARKDEFVFPMAAESAARIQRAGGLVGVGGHGQLQGLGYHWEMWALAMGGMTPREVLKAATIDGATIIGFPADLGSLEPGKLADLVVLDRNPLTDIRNTNSVRYVMKNGELYEGETLDQVWPQQKKLPKFWWWDSQLPASGSQLPAKK